MSRRSFTPRVETLERRLLMTLSALAYFEQRCVANRRFARSRRGGPCVSDAGNRLALGPIGRRENQLLIVRVHDLDSPMLVSIAGGSFAWTDANGLVRLMVPAAASRIELSIGDGSHVTSERFLSIELGADGRIIGYQRLASDSTSSEDHDAMPADPNAMPMPADHHPVQAGNSFPAMSQGFAMGGHDAHATDAAMAHAGMSSMNPAAQGLSPMGTIHSGRMPVTAPGEDAATNGEMAIDASHPEAADDTATFSLGEPYPLEMAAQTLDAVLAEWTSGGDPELVVMPEEFLGDTFPATLLTSDGAPLPAPIATHFPPAGDSPMPARLDFSEQPDGSWQVAGAVTVAIVTAAGAIWLERRPQVLANGPSELSALESELKSAA